MAKQLKRNASQGARTDYVQQLVQAGKITPDGKDWLVAALDPFHDFAHPIAGYPDADTSQTVVSLYQYQATITAPAGVAGDWDCHIFNTPLARNSLFNTVTETATWTQLTEQAVAAQRRLSTLTIVSGAPSALLFPDHTPLVASTVTTGLPAANVDDLVSGNSRIIGMGFEVHNTTSDMYKQGAVTTYRLPQVSGDFCELYANTAGTRITPLSGKRYCSPPELEGEAQRLKSARTWAARDGIYANCFQSEVTNPIRREAPQMVAFSADSNAGAVGMVCASETTLAGVDDIMPTVQKTAPFDTTGAFFTGLSQQTTLLVKLRVYVERAPSFKDYALAPLASPSAGYDINALQLYAQAINMLPCAVKVDENAAGDWFRAVVSVLKHAAGPIGVALNPFLPGASIVGTAVQGMLQQFDQKKPISQQAAKAAVVNRPRIVVQPKQLLAQKAKLKSTRK